MKRGGGMRWECNGGKYRMERGGYCWLGVQMLDGRCWGGQGEMGVRKRSSREKTGRDYMCVATKVRDGGNGVERNCGKTRG